MNTILTIGGIVVLVGLAAKFLRNNPSSPILPMNLTASRQPNLIDLATEFKDQQEREAKAQAIKDNLTTLFASDKAAPK